MMRPLLHMQTRSRQEQGLYPINPLPYAAGMLVPGTDHRPAPGKHTRHFSLSWTGHTPILPCILTCTL